MLKQLQLIILFFLCHYSWSYANAIKGKPDLISIEKEASEYYDQGFYNKSGELYAKALPYCIAERDTFCHKIWIGKIASDLFSGEYTAIGKYIREAEIFFSSFDKLHRKLKFYQAKATYEHYTANFDKALKTFDFAISQAKVSDNDNILVKANLLNSRGNLYIELNQFQNAYRDYKSSLDLMLKMKGSYEEHIATSYNNVGVVHHYLGDFDSANYYYIVAKDQYVKMYGINHPHVARQLYNIGQVYSIRGYYDEALANYQKALEIRVATHGENHVEVAKLYGAIGQLYQELLHYDKALINYKKQNLISKNLYGENHPFLAESLNDIASILQTKKQYDQAKKNYHLAYELRKSHYTENHLDVARSTYNLARFYLEIDNPKEALIWATKNRNIILKVQGKEESLKMQDALELLGDVEAALGNSQNAINYYSKALTLYEKNFHPSHWKLAQVYSKMAEVIALKDPGKAREIYNKAVALAQNIGYDETFQVNKIIHPKYVDVLFERAKFYRQNEMWIEALSDVKKIISLLPQIRKSFLFDNSKLILSEHYREVFEIGVESCWRLYNQTKISEYINQAHLFIEGSKQNVLFEEVHHYSNLQVSGIPAEIIAEEKKVKADLAFLLQETFDYGEDEQIIEKLKIAEIKWLEFSEKIKKLYPGYYNLKYNAQPPTLEQLSEKLKPQQSLIQYFVTEEAIFSIVVNKEESHFFRTENTSSIRNAVEDLIQNIKTNNSKDYFTNALFIYNKIFAELEQYLKNEVVIIPDDFLNALSFESLVLEKTNKKLKESYLIWKYNIQYAASASLFIHQSKHQNKLKHLLAILPYHQSNETMHSGMLPGTVKEISFLKKFFKVNTLEGEGAKVANLEKLISNYDILHFATHAFLDDERPMNSYLQLQGEKFYASTLYQLQTNASLVVLSACNTGVGKVSRGEGSMSLSRGFSYAGCNNIIMSLWSIPDKSTAEIMQSFYKNLSRKRPKSEALRAAKLEYLENNIAHASMPFYWAGIILQGNNDDIFISKRLFESSLFLWIAFSIVSIAIFAIFVFRKIYL
jgi:CHAT domain-containing protein/tetratricopeptide (TPR) repeat protein